MNADGRGGLRIGPRFIIEVIRRRLAVIILAPVVVLGLTVPTLFLLSKHYKATIRILVTDPVLNNNTTVETPLLHRDMESNVKLANAKTLIQSEAFMTEALDNTIGPGKVVKFGKWTATPNVLKDTTVVVTDASSLQITVDTPDPGLSTKLARRMGEQYEQWVARVEVKPTGDTARVIKEKIEQANGEISVLQQKLEVFKRNNRETLPDQATNYLLQKENYKSQMVAANLELEKLRNEAANLDARLKSDPNLKVDPETPVSKKIQDLKAELAQLQATRKDSHPDVIQLKGQIAELENGLAAAGTVNSVSLSVPYRTADARLKEVRAQITAYERSIPRYESEVARLTGALAKMPASEQMVTELSFQLDSRQKTLDRLNQELAGAQLSESILKQIEDEKFITADSPDTALVEPNTKLLIAAAAAGGIALGLLLAIIFEIIDPVIYRIDQLEAHTGMPSLGVVSSNALLG